VVRAARVAMADLYDAASRVLETVMQRRGTAKSLCYSSDFPDKRRLFALVCESLRYHTVTGNIIKAAGLLSMERRVVCVCVCVLCVCVVLCLLVYVCVRFLLSWCFQKLLPHAVRMAP
jgi:hypothetical protein